MEVKAIHLHLLLNTFVYMFHLGNQSASKQNVRAIPISLS